MSTDSLSFQVVAKPFASVYTAELDKKQKITGLNFITNRVDNTSSIALITRVGAKILGCPIEKDLVYSLYAGPRFSPPPTYPPALKEDPLMVDPLHWATDLDMMKIDGIVSHNSFSPQPIKEGRLKYLKDDDKMDTPSALYTLPSLFNHSCHPNAVWHCYGDVMVIRARQDIACDNEITLTYASGDTYTERQRQLKSFLEESSCDCEMCNADRADGEKRCRRRIELREEINAKQMGNLGHSNPSVQFAEGHLRKVLSTYPVKRNLPRPLVFNAYFVAMQSLEREANTQKAIQYGWKALEEAGFAELDTRLTARGRIPSRRSLPLSKRSLATSLVETDICILIMTHISGLFLLLSEVVCSERWFRAAWWGK